MKKLMALALALALGGCYTPQDRAVGGAAIGGVTGATIGAIVGSALTASLACLNPGSSVGVYLPSVSGLPSSFDGAAVITADQPLAAVGNATCVAGGQCDNGDVVYTYNGVNR